MSKETEALVLTLIKDLQEIQMACNKLFSRTYLTNQNMWDIEVLDFAQVKIDYTFPDCCKVCAIHIVDEKEQIKVHCGRFYSVTVSYISEGSSLEHVQLSFPDTLLKARLAQAIEQKSILPYFITRCNGYTKKYT